LTTPRPGLGLTKLTKLSRILLAPLAILVLSLSSQAQNGRYDNFAWTITQIAGQTTYTPIPFAQVAVCAYPANSVPCTNLATIYAGPTTSGGTALNPIQADQYGNFGFWAVGGTYQYTLTSPAGQSSGPYSVVLSSGSGSAGATFPSSPGVVYSTSTTASRNATGTDLSTLLVGSTLTPKVIDGVSQSALYPGSTVDQRVNACLADAIAAANGNTTYTCDATAETGEQNTTAQITVGNSGGDFVRLLVPCSGYWIGMMTDGTSSTVYQYGGTEIDGCPAAGLAGNFGFSAGVSSNLGTVMTIAGSANSYISDRGFDVVNWGNGHTTTSGTGFYINGSTGVFADGSNLFSVNVRDGLDTRAELLENVCCQFAQVHSGISGNGTTIPLTILAQTSPASIVQGLTFAFDTIVGQEPGQPAIVCTDTRSSPISDVAFDHVYGESSDSTTSYVQINGCRKISIDDFSVYSNASNSHAPLVTVANTYNTALLISDMHAYSGTGNYSYPATAVINNFTGETGSNAKLTDSLGDFDHYSPPGIPFTFGSGSIYRATIGGAPALPSDFSYPLIVENNAGAGNGNIDLLNTSNSTSNHRTSMLFNTYISGTPTKLFELGTDASLTGANNFYLYDDLTSTPVMTVTQGSDIVQFGIGPTAPTAPFGTNTTQLATTAFVQSATGVGVATYSTLGSVPPGKAWVYPAQITGAITDAFAAINAAGLTLPSTGGVIDATGLGSATYTVTTPLTALNNSNQAVMLLLNPQTTFIINVNFATPTDSPASCAVPIGPVGGPYGTSSIVVPGHNRLGGNNFQLGSSAKVWDVVCNASFTGSQESVLIDGVGLQGNPAATMSGALMHLAGVSGPTLVANSGTQNCYGQCLEVDAGNGVYSYGSGNMLFYNDTFGDFYVGPLIYPGSVVKFDALAPQGAMGNVLFIGGLINDNGPHNPLFVINGRGSDQMAVFSFQNVYFETAMATPSSYWTNVDPIQFTDASQVVFDSLKVGGLHGSSQPHLIDISNSGSVPNTYGIQIGQLSTGSGYTSLIHNTIDGTDEVGFTRFDGDVILPQYYFGGVVPAIRLTNAAPASGSCTSNYLGSIWTNSTGLPYYCQDVSSTPTWEAIGTAAGLVMNTPSVLGWGASGTADTGLSRSAAGVIDVGNGTAGNTSGQIKASNAQLGAVYLTSFLVSGLPSASGYGATAAVIVTDSTNTVPATCTGSGTPGVYVIAVSNGTNWICP
jgi:hypothetical protein